MKKALLFLMTLSVLAWNNNANSQCPSLTVTATEVCSDYTGLCGCQTTTITVDGTLPPGYSVTNSQLILGGFTFPSGSGTPAFNGTFPNYTFRNDYVASGPYTLRLTMFNGSLTFNCNYSVSVPINSSAASPVFITHYKTVSQLQSGQTAPATIFYENDPISFDGTNSTGTFEYTLSCTHVNQYGTPIGSTVTTTEFYSPDVPLNDFGYQNLRYLFSNLTNPSGMEYTRYYKIDMIGIGCNSQPITATRTIRINQGVRPLLIRGASVDLVEGVYPNPGNGLLTISLIEEQEEVVLSVYNVEGQLVLEQTLNNFLSGTVDLSELRDGVYMLHLAAKDFAKVEKIMIAH